MVLAPAFKSTLAKQTTADGAKLYPQLAWGANPGEVNGLRVESTSNLSSGSSLDRALWRFRQLLQVGLCQGDPHRGHSLRQPDNDAQLGDLNGHNQVYLRGEAYIAGASSTRPPSPTSRPASKEDMTMLYRNKKTGAVIETDCLISGGDWEPDSRCRAGRHVRGRHRG